MMFAALVKRLELPTYGNIHRQGVDKSPPVTPMSDAISVADHILARAAQQQRQLSPLQLMKLVYMSHGWMLGINHQPLFADRVEAWQYGPVIPSLYDRTKRFGSGVIDRPLTFGPVVPLQAEEARIVDSVFDGYSHLSGPALSNLTHRAGSPWSQVWERGTYNIEIPRPTIEAHYAELARTGVVTSA